MILFRLENLERELLRDHRLERIEREVVKHRSDISQLRSELKTFSGDILKRLESNGGFTPRREDMDELVGPQVES